MWLYIRTMWICFMLIFIAKKMQYKVWYLVKILAIRLLEVAKVIVCCLFVSKPLIGCLVSWSNLNELFVVETRYTSFSFFIFYLFLLLDHNLSGYDGICENMPCFIRTCQCFWDPIGGVDALCCVEIPLYPKNVILSPKGMCDMQIGYITSSLIDTKLLWWWVYIWWGRLLCEVKWQLCVVFISVVVTWYSYFI